MRFDLGSVTEQGIDILVRNLGKGARLDLPSEAPSLLPVHVLEDLVHLGTCSLDTQSDQTQGGPLVEDHQQDRSAGDDGDVNVIALALMEQHRELSLADQLGEPVGLAAWW